MVAIATSANLKMTRNQYACNAHVQADNRLPAGAQIMPNGFVNTTTYVEASSMVYHRGGATTMTTTI
jgi:tetrahydrodipicolinate N-succinyltransferase